MESHSGCVWMGRDKWYQSRRSGGDSEENTNFSGGFMDGSVGSVDWGDPRVNNTYSTASYAEYYGTCSQPGCWCENHVSYPSWEGPRPVDKYYEDYYSQSQVLGAENECYNYGYPQMEVKRGVSVNTSVFDAYLENEVLQDYAPLCASDDKLSDETCNENDKVALEALECLKHNNESLRQIASSKIFKSEDEDATGSVASIGNLSMILMRMWNHLIRIRLI